MHIDNQQFKVIII